MKRHWVRPISLLIILVLLFSPLAGGVWPVAAAASLTVTPATAAQGAMVQVRGSGFDPTDAYGDLYLDAPNNTDGIYLGRSVLGADGSLLFDILVPPAAPAGIHWLIVQAINRTKPTETAQVSINVTASARKAALITGPNTAVDASFKALLDANGIATTLMAVGTIGAGTSFASYDLVLIGPDSTVNGTVWGTPAALTALSKFTKPILGIGDGGYYYFGSGGRNQNLLIGYGNGAHGSATDISLPAPSAEPFRRPYLLGGSPLTLFSSASATVEIYLPQANGSFFSLGTNVQNPAYHILAQQGRFFEWGFDGQASTMTATGRNLFVNVAWYLIYLLSRDTLVVSNLPRMQSLAYATADVNNLNLKLTDLVGRPFGTSNMNAIWVDLSIDAPAGVKSNLTSWASNLASPVWTNTAAHSIDDYMENLKHAVYPNLKYYILVGSQEVIPMLARAVDNYNETSWGIAAGYLADLYHSTVNGATNGYYLTDSLYSDLSYVNDTWGTDSMLVPEMSVGRMVETPAQISASITTYLASFATIVRTQLAAIGSQDYMDGASFAANEMGPTADISLIQTGFLSSLVPPLLNSKHSIVYIGGHGDYNWMTTRFWDQGFMAGATGSEGDTEELSTVSNAVIAAAGCHNGVVFPNQTYHSYSGTTDYGEFPERLMNKQVGVYAAATGFTWVSISGSSTSLADTMYSEKATALFIKHLMDDGFTTAGKAFNSAVKQYINERGKDSLGNSLLDGGDRRAISIFTFYGIPNYRFSAVRHYVAKHYGYFLKVATLALAPQSVNAAAQVTQQVTLDVTDYTVQPDGLVTIPGAAYSGDSDHPILPVVSATQLLPAEPTGLTILWNQAASTSTTITNDVPAVQAGLVPTPGAPVFIQPNNMTFSGFYPASLLYSTTTNLLGGGGTELNLGVMPVQYNKDTHTTRIWTHLVFNVSYNSDTSLNSVDSDGDGLPDWWETANSLDPFSTTGANGAAGDPDQDGLSNLQEYQRGTDPMNPDTDGDGFLDGFEVKVGTDPLNPGSSPLLTYLPLLIK